MRWMVAVFLALLVATAAVTNVMAAVTDDAAAPQRTFPVPLRPATTVPIAPGTPVGGVTTTATTAARVVAFSMAEVAAHDSNSDCWLAIGGYAYDVTTYLAQHPGGARTIIPWCGKESTVAFATEGGRGEHSDQAYADLAGFVIGVVDG